MGLTVAPVPLSLLVDGLNGGRAQHCPKGPGLYLRLPEATRVDRVSSAWASSPSVQQGSDAPGPARVAPNIPPCPPPGWQRGPLWGGGRARGSHDSRAGPASCSAASGGPWLTAEPLFRPEALAPPTGWPGQRALLSSRPGWSPRWEPGALWAPEGFKSSALCGAGRSCTGPPNCCR